MDKHLQKLMKFFDDVLEAEQERERQEERRRLVAKERAKERKKKGNKRTASMLVSGLLVLQLSRCFCAEIRHTCTLLVSSSDCYCCA